MTRQDFMLQENYIMSRAFSNPILVPLVPHQMDYVEYEQFK